MFAELLPDYNKTIRVTIVIEFKKKKRTNETIHNITSRKVNHVNDLPSNEDFLEMIQFHAVHTRIFSSIADNRHWIQGLNCTQKAYENSTNFFTRAITPTRRPNERER